MLHNLMIMSGKGGIVLFRKTFTKAVNQPRLIAGLVTALCEFSINSGVGVPVNTIEFQTFTINIVEIQLDDLNHDNPRESLRAVLFHDTSDGDFYGHVLGIQFLTTFQQTYGERLQSMRLGNVDGVEAVFRDFSKHIRAAVQKSYNPLMKILESHIGVKYVYLLGHRRNGVVKKTIEDIWYASSESSYTSNLLSDIQTLMAVSDDLLSPTDETSVVNLGSNILIQRLDIATLVVVTDPPYTATSCQYVISSSANVLKHLFQLMNDLEGSTDVRS